MIVLCRVDHRLLHGQVAFTWTQNVGSNCILIANDAVAKDDLRMTALRVSKPNGVKLVIKSIDDSLKALNSGVTDKYKLMILCESIKDAARLVEGYGKIKSINLGGIKNETGKKQISKAISVNEEEVEILKELNEKGIELEVRMVPDDSKQDVMKLI
ncbi:PTS system mannose/fructose/N-acetylgalactosamine-transporter subunit IIB [Holdemanella biformis]|uniref:PTS system mannose/fructose/N-acetylgalactosamine-transporter subunit IIB n=1 Tax=Holdemanella biformis TaxID=1735 RepID=UPI002665BAFF|nr:PTS sugar transporter subunit IIB [Holdemanella biformis]